MNFFLRELFKQIAYKQVVTKMLTTICPNDIIFIFINIFKKWQTTHNPKPSDDRVSILFIIRGRDNIKVDKLDIVTRVIINSESFKYKSKFRVLKFFNNDT